MMMNKRTGCHVSYDSLNEYTESVKKKVSKEILDEAHMKFEYAINIHQPEIRQEDANIDKTLYEYCSMEKVYGLKMK